MDASAQENVIDQKLLGIIRKVLSEAGFWTVTRNKGDEDKIGMLTTAWALISRYRSEAHTDRHLDREAFRSWLTSIPESEKLGVLSKFHRFVFSAAQVLESYKADSGADAILVDMLAMPVPDEQIRKINADHSEIMDIYCQLREGALSRSAEIDAVLALPEHARSTTQVELLSCVEGSSQPPRWFLLPNEMKALEDEAIQLEQRMLPVTVGRLLEGLAITCMALVPFVVWLLSTLFYAVVSAVVLWWLSITWMDNRKKRSSAQQLTRLNKWTESVKKRLVASRA